MRERTETHRNAPKRTETHLTFIWGYGVISGFNSGRPNPQARCGFRARDARRETDRHQRALRDRAVLALARYLDLAE
jgi:hypothetical protein